MSGNKYTETESSVRGIAATLWGIARGTVDSIRLSAAERLTLLFAAIAMAALATILVTAIILFLSIGAAQVLKSVTPYGAYFIVAGFYALLLVLLFAFRRSLIVDPIARLITRLIVAPPEEYAAPEAQSSDSPQPVPAEVEPSTAPDNDEDKD